MTVQKSKQIRLMELNYKTLKTIAESNRYGLSIARLANLAIERALPALKKEFGK
jgi:hypothetical protein